MRRERATGASSKHIDSYIAARSRQIPEKERSREDHGAAWRIGNYIKLYIYIYVLPSIPYIPRPIADIHTYIERKSSTNTVAFNVNIYILYIYIKKHTFFCESSQRVKLV